MKRSIAILAATMVVSSLMAGPAMAKPEKFAESHGHMLVTKLQVEFVTGDGVPYDGLYLTGYNKCVDMPVTPLRAHHANIHIGDGIDPDTGMGINIRGLRTAGHAFIPSSNHPSPWDGCAALADSLPFPLSPPPAD